MVLPLVSNPFIPKNGPSQRGKVEEKAKKTIVFGAGLIISFLMTVQWNDHSGGYSPGDPPTTCFHISVFRIEGALISLQIGTFHKLSFSK